MFQDDDWLTEGIMFTYPVDQAVIIDGKVTGKVLGPAHDVNGQKIGSVHYIVLLDRPTAEAKAVVAHEDSLQLLTCHWCMDTRRVPSGPFTKGQHDTDTFPKEPCPYCTESVVTHG
jgi:hypothetical protein